MKNDPLILGIEDDPAICHFLKSGLVDLGFRFEFASTGETGLSLVHSLNPEVVLLDLGLPDMDGLDLVKNLRTWTSVPTIVISARDQETEKIKALDLGADDYVTKPFGLGELAARIKVALRHQVGKVLAPKEAFGNLVIDWENRRVFLEKNEVHLSPIEYKLLSVLAQNPGKILTHRFLLNTVWGSLEPTHYVRIYMASLRKKIETDVSNPQFIHTEIGTGYRFFR